jgi:hypothetical protein
MSDGVVHWWYFLCSVATLNVVTWCLAAAKLERHRDSLSVDTYAAGRIQVALSGVYVFGCAFRSVLPVFDIPRLCLFDTWLSSVLVGRSVATFAEMCFAAQWAALLGATAKLTRSAVARTVSFLVLPLIAAAETCSWYAVLTTSNLTHIAENSLWGIAALLIVVAILTVAPRYAATRRRTMIAWCLAGIAYVAFMFLFDVPMYWARWIAEPAAGQHYLSLAQGLADVANHWVVSYRWDDWKSEVTWMSLYFSTGVWVSISLTQVRVRASALPQRSAALSRRHIAELDSY